jgi:hypothetical protein
MLDPRRFTRRDLARRNKPNRDRDSRDSKDGRDRKKGAGTGLFLLPTPGEGSPWGVLALLPLLPVGGRAMGEEGWGDEGTWLFSLFSR